MNRQIRNPITLEPEEAAMVYAVISSPAVGIPANMTRIHARVLDKIKVATEPIEGSSGIEARQSR